MAQHPEANARQLYWYRDDFPNPLRHRLHRAHNDFMAATRTILQDVSLSRIVTANLNPGIVTYRVVDPEARLYQFCRLCMRFLSEISEAWAEHLIERVGLRGDKAIKAFEKHAQEFVLEALDVNWKWGLRELKLAAEDELFWT